MPTIADLPIGAKLKFGAYSVSGEMPHKICWVKAHRDGTILTEFMEDQCAFDAKEPDNPDEYRKSYGNNRCSVSNVQQFLNAEGTDWFRQKHGCDTAPEDRGMCNGRYGYSHKPGFLHYFEEWEIEAIYAYSDYMGVRPALKLNPEIPISDEPDGDGYYEVLSAPQEIIEIDEDDFFAVLKKM